MLRKRLATAHHATTCTSHLIGSLFLLQVRYDAEVAALRTSVEKVVLDLVVGPRSSVATRRAILPHIHTLAAFIGRRWASR